mmetsp:Transcript_33870/g.100934  ORF Transcript_33870/g.100934 Transcript_33870/m.100934 type:complete len:216 (+) Transcript_33870:1153-1800(+)
MKCGMSGHWSRSSCENEESRKILPRAGPCGGCNSGASGWLPAGPTTPAAGAAHGGPRGAAHKSPSPMKPVGTVSALSSRPHSSFSRTLSSVQSAPTSPLAAVVAAVARGTAAAGCSSAVTSPTEARRSGRRSLSAPKRHSQPSQSRFSQSTRRRPRASIKPARVAACTEYSSKSHSASVAAGQEAVAVGHTGEYRRTTLAGSAIPLRAALSGHTR